MHKEQLTEFVKIVGLLYFLYYCWKYIMDLSSNWKQYLGVSSNSKRSIKQRSKKRSRPNSKRNEKANNTNLASQLTNQFTERQKSVTHAVSLDCEMVGVQDGKESILARVSVVNSYGYCLYDTFVKATEHVVDYRTNVSGVRAIDMANGVEFHVAQKAVADLLKGRLLVGHGIRNDLKVLYISHPWKRMRDTSKYPPFRLITKGRTPSLKRLANDILGIQVQKGEHSSVEDARAAMQLYNLYKTEWESEKYKK